MAVFEWSNRYRHVGVVPGTAQLMLFQYCHSNLRKQHWKPQLEHVFLVEWASCRSLTQEIRDKILHGLDYYYVHCNCILLLFLHYVHLLLSVSLEFSIAVWLGLANKYTW